MLSIEKDVRFSEIAPKSSSFGELECACCK